MKHTEETIQPGTKVWSNHRWGIVTGTKDGALKIRLKNQARRKARAKIEREIALFTEACETLH